MNVLLRPIAEEEIVVREGLKAGRLAHGEAAALHRIGVNEVVPILRDVAGDRGRRLPGELDAEAIVENAAVPVAVVWAER